VNTASYSNSRYSLFTFYSLLFDVELILLELGRRVNSTKPSNNRYEQ
jgi:hypothetical protein